MDEEVKNLENSNFLHLYGFCLQLHKQLNLTKQDTITNFDLSNAYSTFWVAENTTKPVTGSAVRVVKLRLINYLVELSVIKSKYSYKVTEIDLTMDRKKFYALYESLKKRYLRQTLDKTSKLIIDKGTPLRELEKSHTTKENNGEHIYEIEFKEGIIYLNGIYMTKPQFGSINYDFFEFVYKKPNERHNLKELMDHLKQSNKKKTVHQILSDLKFKGEIKTLFFRASSTAVEFTNPITEEILKNKGIEHLSLVEISRNLVEKPKSK